MSRQPLGRWSVEKMNTPLCETCRFAIDLGEDTTPRTMQCRRWPRQLCDLKDEWGKWPKMLADEWCGEWRKAPGLRPAAKIGGMKHG